MKLRCYDPAHHPSCPGVGYRCTSEFQAPELEVYVCASLHVNEGICNGLCWGAAHTPCDEPAKRASREISIAYACGGTLSAAWYAAGAEERGEDIYAKEGS